MKTIRRAVVALMIVLFVAVFLYIDNKEFNQLASGAQPPLDTVVEGLVISDGPVELDMGIHVSELYYAKEQEALYLGMWYEDRNQHLKDEKWYKEKGAVSFLVKAVDSNGTTFTGRTEEREEGTFSTFQFVKIEDFHLIDQEEYRKGPNSLTFSFYPMLDKEEPRKQALFHVDIPLVLGNN
ncbi:hypothetical protein EQV77_11560 [Halobacillus fulvus]|nr:hypothetical protein EQV77_11560 [Halobacillus fulvus]